eukprot:11767553-Alexandrium_andersonii.AAC.1
MPSSSRTGRSISGSWEKRDPLHTLHTRGRDGMNTASSRTFTSPYVICGASTSRRKRLTASFRRSTHGQAPGAGPSCDG